MQGKSQADIIIIIIIKYIWWRAITSTCDRRILGAGGHMDG